MCNAASPGPGSANGQGKTEKVIMVVVPHPLAANKQLLFSHYPYLFYCVALFIRGFPVVGYDTSD